MTILVTGANGFIGQAVVKELAHQGRSVRACVRTRNINFTTLNNISVSEVGDLNDKTNWDAAIAGVKTVVHTAARVHVMNENTADPLSAFRKVNVLGTLHLARKAALNGVKRFVFISSIKVNGEFTFEGNPFRADDSPKPLDPYAISKHEAELGLLQIASETGMEVVIVRPPLVYGPGVKANFSAMIRYLDMGVPLPLGAVTKNRRSLIALGNFVNFLITCIFHPAAANQIFLVSDGEDLSTTELLLRIGAAMNKKIFLVPVPPKLLQFGANLLGKCDMAQRLLGNLQLDIDKSRQLLGWSPVLSVDEGLRQTVQGI